MPTRVDYSIPPPTTWEAFESLCRDLWAEIWNDNNTQKNGRQSQPQHGVDVYGEPKKSHWAGLQAKEKGQFPANTLTITELRAEVSKAKSFTPALKEYTLAAGLSGLGLAISADSIKQKWLEMATADNSLKDIKRITFDDTESAEFAVATFYNYLKVRKLEKAFEILSDNFKQGHGFDYWKGGYDSLLDTTVIKIEEDKKAKDRVTVKLSTKDMVDDEIVYKYFEGYWDVKNIDGKWRLWDPEIKEVENPGYLWFYE